MVPASPTQRRPNIQLRRDNAAALLAWLSEAIGDGPLTASQIDQLRDWIAAHTSLDGSADAFFANILSRIVRDGRVTADDRVELLLAIENVLPLTERGVARAMATGAPTGVMTLPSAAPPAEGSRASAGTPAALPAAPVRWQDQPWLEPQRNLILALGGAAPRQATRAEASELIESLFAQKSPTRRQRRLLRFWGRELRAGEGPRHVALWLEGLEAEDRDRKRAWDLFVHEVDDDPLQPETARVPVGIGRDYLARIKRGGAAAQPSGERARRRLPLAVWVSCLFAVISIGVAVMFYLKPWRTNERGLEGGKADSPAPLDNAAYVAALKIGGAIGGSRMQVMIGDTLYAAGDVIDAGRGLMVMKIDDATRRVTFIDTAGKTYVRSLD